MKLNFPLIKKGVQPTYSRGLKIGSRFSRIFRKVSLAIVIFLLFFHLPIFIPEFIHRHMTIQEIQGILESQPTGLSHVEKGEIAKAIYAEAKRHNYDPKFILALIAIESSFKNESVSVQGAKGLMQLMPYVAQSLAPALDIEWAGDQTLFNPHFNIRIGSYYLAQLILDFNDLRLALTAYNYGPTYVKSLIERKEQIPPHYYRRVLYVYQNI